MNLCIACEKNEANFDYYLCGDCATRQGMVSPDATRALYRNALASYHRIVKLVSGAMPYKSDNTASGITYLGVLASTDVSLNAALRLLYQARLMSMLEGVPGDIVECGAGKGQTLLYWCILAQEKLRNVWGFDSFEGFPTVAPEDDSPRNSQKGSWTPGLTDVEGKKVETDYIDYTLVVPGLLKVYGIPDGFVQSHVTLVKGWFVDSLPKYTGDQIALLHLDCDLYESYRDSLELLGDKCVGIIAVDEYMGTLEHYNFPGAKKAVDEWLEKHKADWELRRDNAYGKYYLLHRSLA